jgi:hypothetical protein
VPPYGKDNVPELQTIFDLQHLHGKAKFLKVQCKRIPSALSHMISMIDGTIDRMPVSLGNFISLHVYDGKLESEHRLTSKSCLSFVDAQNGLEEKSGFSWQVRSCQFISILRKLTFLV